MSTIMRENITYKATEVPQTLTGFKNWEFTSGPVIDEDFRVFARLFKKYIASHLPANSSLVSFSRGHYEVSGFIERQGKFVYFSLCDVRFFPGKWHNEILIRTARSASDYTGGRNNYTRLEDFQGAAETLLNQ